MLSCAGVLVLVLVALLAWAAGRASAARGRAYAPEAVHPASLPLEPWGLWG